jgi:hypothetical protein
MWWLSYAFVALLLTVALGDLIVGDSSDKDEE